MRQIFKTKFQFVFLLSLLLLLSNLSVSAQTKPIEDLKPTLILISLDGFRYDYPAKYKPTNLNRLAREGVRAKWLIPSFPSKTFPNHYTIATGLYPQNHGIIENNIYDKNFDAVFGLGKREEVQNPRWWLGEPIWVTAEKQGQKAGAFFFPGTEAEIKGTRPTFWKTYDGNIPNEERVDTILSWLDLPVAERPTIYTLYFSDVDDAGHGFSPDSAETKNAVQRVDNMIGRLIEGLKAREVFGLVNLIIVSDHGMATVNQNNAIILDELFDVSLAERILWTGEIVQIFPKEGKEDEIYKTLKSKLRHAKIYRKAEIPKRFHYSNSPRIAPLIISSQEGWMLVSDRKRFEDMKARDDFNHLKGAHGYDNQLKSMRAIFIAHGAAFKKRKVVAPFQNIHVYNIMAKILRLKPAKNDGNFVVAKKVLR
jgi:predicted AlkP superfamily pyrophosphatase or phosphodiesterase